MSACHRLTKREQEVMVLVANGKRNRQIAERLTITEGTVEVHLHNIFQKLDCTTRTEAALLYMTSIERANVASLSARSQTGATDQCSTEDPFRERDTSGRDVRVSALAANSVAATARGIDRRARYDEPATPHRVHAMQDSHGQSRYRRGRKQKNIGNPA